MKKVLVYLTLALCTAAAAQTQQQPTGAAGDQQAQGQQSQSGQKTIKDPAEYNAYVSALQQTDANAKVQALEGFLQQYPNSIVREDALEAIMATFQQQNNLASTAQAAQRLLQINQNHVPALAVMVVQRQQAQNMNEARQYAERGLQALTTWQRPETVPQAQFEQQKKALTSLFNSTIGGALFAAKDYAGAPRYLRAAYEADPNNAQTAPQLAAQLGVSYLEAKPGDPILGLWLAARAAAMTNDPGLTKYARAKYVNYHGGEDGWNELLAQARTSPYPPQGFIIKPAPTPQEIADKVLAENEVGKLAFSDWEFILQNGSPASKDAVWTHIQSLGVVKLAGKVVASTRESMQVAVAKDKQESNTADVQVNFTEPLKAIPATGTMVQFTGAADSYTPEPLLITFRDGALVGKGATAPGRAAGAGAKKGAAGPKKPTRRRPR